MAEGSVWSDPERARQVVEEVKALKRWIEPYGALRKQLDDAQALNDLAEAEHTEELAQELEAEAAQIAARLEALDLQNMLRGRDDGR